MGGYTRWSSIKTVNNYDNKQNLGHHCSVISEIRAQYLCSLYETMLFYLKKEEEEEKIDIVMRICTTPNSIIFWSFTNFFFF